MSRHSNLAFKWKWQVDISLYCLFFASFDNKHLNKNVFHYLHNHLWHLNTHFAGYWRPVTLQYRRRKYPSFAIIKIFIQRKLVLQKLIQLCWSSYKEVWFVISNDHFQLINWQTPHDNLSWTYLDEFYCPGWQPR